MQAAQGKPEAGETFRKFIHDFPQSPRVSEAWVALAELAFHATKPELETARRIWRKRDKEIPTPTALERADYLEIWIEDATPSADETAVITAANKFLQQYPDSRFTAEVTDETGRGLFSTAGFCQRPDAIRIARATKARGSGWRRKHSFLPRAARRRAWARARSIMPWRSSTRW